MALLEDNSEARTERPTERRRRQARESGQVARSVELLNAARLLAIWIVLAAWFAKFATSTSSSIRSVLEHAGSTRLPPATAIIQLRDLAWQFVVTASWPLLTATAALLVAHFVQIGWLWRWENLAPQWSRLSPVAGLQRLSPTTTIGRALGLILKLAVFISTSGLVFSSLLPEPASNLSSDFSRHFTTFGSNAMQLVTHVGMSLLIFGALDYAWQRWRFERSLQMTQQEVREELTELEGNPLLKIHRQSQARQ